MRRVSVWRGSLLRAGLIIGLIIGWVALASSPGPAGVAAEPHSPEKPKATPSSAQALGGLIGPALETPQEVFDLLEQRKRALDRREEAVRTAESRLAVLKGEIEQLLARAEKAREAAASGDAESRKVNLAHVAKIYETMPPEEAAARIEKMPTKTAIEVLHQLKGKTAGAILSLVKPEVAAKLTERYMAVPVKTPKIGN